ncbi:hypothetical protein JOF56_005973 [Kibdelosporangium banguiense]|uniref:DUF1707 domain-containing protein n=1 Tax=Kibdelosporangium banguiense TaxID=1365924 RepID=A0ABS4TMF4_9PSEU|nr:DUF1707 domain-containing protein [Kibdelosporangium banguiense]MBP2325588.1 hypothetical protein [Kibdelosporangium banguiense]
MDDAGIRISDTKRDEAISTLGKHMSTGRLELSEYEERCGRAATARTRGELEALFEDLPAPHPDLSSATPPAVKATAPARRSAKDVGKTPANAAFEALGALSFIVGIPGATLLTIFLGMWWVFFPVIGMLIIAGAMSQATKKPENRRPGQS